MRSTTSSKTMHGVALAAAAVAWLSACGPHGMDHDAGQRPANGASQVARFIALEHVGVSDKPVPTLVLVDSDARADLELLAGEVPRLFVRVTPADLDRWAGRLAAFPEKPPANLSFGVFRARRVLDGRPPPCYLTPEQAVAFISELARAVNDPPSTSALQALLRRLGAVAD